MSERERAMAAMLAERGAEAAADALHRDLITYPDGELPF